MSDAINETFFQYKLSVFTVGRCFSPVQIDRQSTGIGNQVRSNHASGRESRGRGRLAPAGARWPTCPSAVDQFHTQSLR